MASATCKKDWGKVSEHHNITKNYKISGIINVSMLSENIE